MRPRLFPRWLTFVLGLVTATLALTGFAQMPIFKRYYLADIPGLGWLAAYFVTHTIHYVAAAAFLGLLAYMTTVFFRARARGAGITAWGALRIITVIIIIGSGILRVLKNRPDVYFAPDLVFAIDLVHLGAVMLWGILALAAALVGRRPYLRARG